MFAVGVSRFRSFFCNIIKLDIGDIWLLYFSTKNKRKEEERMALLFFLRFALKGSSEHLMIYSFAHMNVITIISKLEVNPLLGDMARHNSRAERNQQQQQKICLFETLPHFDRQFQ